MTNDADEENLFRSLTTSSTILLKTGKNQRLIVLLRKKEIFSSGEMCKPYRRLDSSAISTGESEWTLSFEQLEAAVNAESCLVNWFETISQTKSLDERIHNYNQDFLR